jgi:hypothetical protein
MKKQLTPEASAAIELLTEAVKGDGRVFVRPGREINVGARKFVEPNNPRSIAFWETVVEELCNKKRLKAVGEYGYKVTGPGYTFVDKLKSEGIWPTLE